MSEVARGVKEIVRWRFRKGAPLMRGAHTRFQVKLLRFK
jgi:hypothetical protein